MTRFSEELFWLLLASPQLYLCQRKSSKTHARKYWGGLSHLIYFTWEQVNQNQRTEHNLLWFLLPWILLQKVLSLQTLALTTLSLFMYFPAKDLASCEGTDDYFSITMFLASSATQYYQKWNCRYQIFTYLGPQLHLQVNGRFVIIFVYTLQSNFTQFS